MCLAIETTENTEAVIEIRMSIVEYATMQCALIDKQDYYNDKIVETFNLDIKKACTDTLEVLESLRVRKVNYIHGYEKGASEQAPNPKT